jgi:DNA gyrase subunit A
MMHDKVLFFSSKGIVYSLNVYDFPEGGRQSKGLPIVNVLPIEQGEQITAVVPVSNFSHDMNLIMLTQKGFIKRIELDNFANIRRSGIIAISLEENDRLNWVKLAKGNDEIIIGTSCGMAIRFPIEDLRPLGRSARGVISMKLRAADTIIGCDIVPKNYDADLLVVTSDGFGKRTKLSEFRPQNRGGIGLIATKFKSSMSRLVALTIVEEKDEIMLVTANGIVTRIKAGDISCQGRPATGVRAQNLIDNDTVASVNKIVNTDDEDEDYGPAAGSSAVQEAEQYSEQTSLLTEDPIQEEQE